MKVDWREVPGRYIKDPRLGHRLGRNYPAGEVTDSVWDLRWLGTDDLGLVYNESSTRDFDLRDTGFRRVFLFGGSTLMGLGVPRNMLTISSVLERLLRDEIPNARTINCGVGAYASWQEMLYLAIEIIHTKPDVIVVLDGWNDFVHSSWGNKGYGGNWIPNTHRSLDDIVSLVQMSTGDVSLFDFMLQKLRKIPFIRELQSQSHYAIHAGVWSDPDYRRWSLKPEAVTYYVNNLRTIIGIAIAHGAKVATFFQPQLMWGQRKATQHERMMVEKIVPRMPPIPDLAPKWFELVQEAFENLHDELHHGGSVWVENATGWLDDIEETVYHDYNHYNELGQRILAEKIGERILAMWKCQDEIVGRDSRSTFLESGRPL